MTHVRISNRYFINTKVFLLKDYIWCGKKLGLPGKDRQMYHSPHICINIEVNDLIGQIRINKEAITVVSKQLCKKTFPGVRLREMNVLLHNYIKEQTGALGSIPAAATHKDIC